MNLFTIALRNLTYRKLPTALTMLSMALGVALVVLVLTISGVIQKTFDRTSNVGYNLIIGAKGSDIQLTFNTVFFLSQPVRTFSTPITWSTCLAMAVKKNTHGSAGC